MQGPKYPVLGGALFGAALAPAIAMAQMSCAELGGYLGTQPFISPVSPTTPLTTLTPTGTNARCEANFI